MRQDLKHRTFQTYFLIRIERNPKNKLKSPRSSARHRFYSGDIINFAFDALPDFKFYDFTSRTGAVCVRLQQFGHLNWLAYIVIAGGGRNSPAVLVQHRTGEGYLDHRMK